MKCDEARELLTDYLNGALDEVAEARLLQHLRSCAACDYELRRIPAVESDIAAIDTAVAARRSRLIDLLSVKPD
jgi:predicted anti-sigma-YlaC factor YlaD